MRREYLKRTAVILVVVLWSLLARKISDSPWGGGIKYYHIPMVAVVIYFLSFWLADLAAPIQGRRKEGR